MSVILSSDDVQRLARAVELLVSPLDHATVDDWRSVVNRELMQLLGADSAGFMLPVSEGPFIYSEEHDPAELARYPGYMPPPLPDGTSLWDSVLDMEVGRLVEMYRGNAEVYLESPYYREYAGANGAHDTICVSVPGRTRDITDSASIQLWHGSPRGRKFGERELALLRILRPALRAGVETQRMIGAQHGHVIEMMDALGHAVRICDAQGRRLHRSRALAEMLRVDPEADRIVAALDEAVSVARLGIDPCVAAAVRPTPPTLTFEAATSTARYRITVSLCRNLAGAPGSLLIAAVQRTTPVPMDEAGLQAKFGLTRAEARVATLIGGGLSNAEIAQRLCISPHTARRHTERVLLKLGARSRAEVAATILT